MNVIATQLKLRDKECFGLYYEVSGLVSLILLLSHIPVYSLVYILSGKNSNYSFHGDLITILGCRLFMTGHVSILPTDYGPKHSQIKSKIIITSMVYY